MKIIKDSKNKLLVRKVKRIEEIIASTNPLEEDIYEATVDFILVFEHVIQKVLYLKNKLLIYEFNLDINKVTAILKEKKHTLHTIQLVDLLSRYINIFPKSKLSKEGKSIEILINNRNILQHDIDLKNILNKNDLLGILGRIFPIFLPEAEKVLGELPPTKIKKEENYSEQNIQKIYDKIVLSKINNYQNDSIFSPVISLSNTNRFDPTVYSSGLDQLCPRCGKYALSKKYNSSPFIYSSISLKNDPDLYSCHSCNLELTDLEYEAVQRLRKEGKISSSGIF